MAHVYSVLKLYLRTVLYLKRTRNLINCFNIVSVVTRIIAQFVRFIAV